MENNNNNNLNSQPKQEIIQEMNFSKTNVEKLNEEISQDLKKVNESLKIFKQEMFEIKIKNYNELEKRIEKLEENVKKLNTKNEKNNDFVKTINSLNTAINSLNKWQKNALKIHNQSLEKIEEQHAICKSFEEKFNMNCTNNLENVDVKHLNLLTLKKNINLVFENIKRLNNIFKTTILKICNEQKNYIEKTEKFILFTLKY